MASAGCTRDRRASPVFEIAAKIEGCVVRLGLDTLAGVSCVGSGDLTKEQFSCAVSTSEHQHHTGGEALRSTSEVTLCVEVSCSAWTCWSCTTSSGPPSCQQLVEHCAFRKKQLLAVSCKAFTCSVEK